MLNRAARYFPILRVLRQQNCGRDSILEIGSGPSGIGQFRCQPFVGCDLCFPERPAGPMLPVIGTATRLPFGNRSFEVVIACDVMEHIPPEHRKASLHEALRVARKLVICGFPCGPQAFAHDQKLFQRYRQCNREVPGWLIEHMRHPFPTEALFEDVGDEWVVTHLGNESLRFHLWMMRKEMHRWWSYIFAAALALFPAAVDELLRIADREPCYRRIWILRRGPIFVS